MQESTSCNGRKGRNAVAIPMDRDMSVQDAPALHPPGRNPFRGLFLRDLGDLGVKPFSLPDHP